MAPPKKGILNLRIKIIFFCIDPTFLSEKKSWVF